MEILIDILNIAFIILLLGAGVAGILIANYLYKRYRLQYLQSYFYYQMLLAIFGIYGLLGTVLARVLLNNLESPPELVVTIGHIIPFLGVPFLIAALYMFLKVCFELVGTQLSRSFTYGFFIFHVFFFLAYGVIILNLPDIESDQYAYLTELVIYAFLFIEVLSISIGITKIFLSLKRIKGKDKRQFIKRTTFLVLFVHLIIVALIPFINRNEIVAGVFLFVFFSGNILPLFYIGKILDKQNINTIQEGDLDSVQLLEQYEITKRESEIVNLICDGMTNKEIADKLFITLQTVKDHTHNIYIKTGVRNRVELINLIRKM